jgi:hypothetical protein
VVSGDDDSILDDLLFQAARETAGVNLNGVIINKVQNLEIPGTHLPAIRQMGTPVMGVILTRANSPTLRYPTCPSVSSPKSCGEGDSIGW